jgi:hypothetical protein
VLIQSKKMKLLELPTAPCVVLVAIYPAMHIRGGNVPCRINVFMLNFLMWALTKKIGQSKLPLKKQVNFMCGRGN